MRRSSRSAAGIVELPCVCATARLAARAVSRLYDDHLKSSGVEAAQFALLTLIDRLGPCNQATIGQAFAMDKTTVSRNVTLLKKNRWIEEVASTDRRHRCYALSTAGRTRLAAARPAWRRAQQRLRSAMTPQEWEAMFVAFRSLARATGTIDG